VVTLSIIIVSYNTKALLKQCLCSVMHSLQSEREQRPEDSFEVFVVDNDSHDGSAEMVAECFPEVVSIRSPRNVGFAAANNIAIPRASGKHLIFLNPDTVVKGNALWELADFMDRVPGAGAATGSFVYPDGSFQDGAFRFPSLWMTLLDFFPYSNRLLQSSLNGRYPRHLYNTDRSSIFDTDKSSANRSGILDTDRSSIFDAPFEIDHPLGACFIVRRKVLEDIGPFSEDFFLYSEEVEWCWRIKKSGWRIYCYPEPTIVHYSGQSTSQYKNPMYLELHKSRMIFLKKHYSPLFCAVNRVLVGFGMLWESFRALRAANRGEISKEDSMSRINICIRIFRMAIKGV